MRTIKRIRQFIRHGNPDRRLNRIMGRGRAIPTHMSTGELLLLFDEACRVGGPILEVGSYLGASSVVIGEALRRHGKPGDRLYCVDTWKNDAMSEGARDTYAAFKENTAHLSDTIVPVRGNSADVQLPTEGPFGLVFVDGDHSYEATLRDIERFAPLVRDGGVLLLHDTDRPEVLRAVAAPLAQGKWRILAIDRSLLVLLACRDNQRTQ